MFKLRVEKALIKVCLLCASICFQTISPSSKNSLSHFRNEKQYFTIRNMPITLLRNRNTHTHKIRKCGPALLSYINNTYSYNPVTPSSQSQNLPEKYIRSSADRREKYERTPDISGACIVERPDLTIIIIHNNLEGKL